MTKQKTHRFSSDFYDGVCEMLQTDKIPYKAQVSRNRRTIETCFDKYVFSDANIPFCDLSMIKETKAQMIKSGENVRNINSWDIQYYKISINNEFSLFTKNVVELDLSKAYWCAAKNLGFISEGTFLKGLDMEKVSRLAAIGASAVVKWDIIFDGEKFTEIKETFDRNGRNAFFAVCAEVSRVMQKAAGDVAHLFWVDAIFCSAEHAEQVAKVFGSEGYEYKQKNIKWARYLIFNGRKELHYLEAMEETNKLCRIRIKKFTFVEEKNNIFKKRAENAHLKNIKKAYGI